MIRAYPLRIISEFLDSGGELIQLIKKILGEISDMLKQVKQGKVKIGFEHRGLEDFVFHMDRTFNRIAFPLISALIIGSSLIIQTNIGPYLFEFPILGLLGFSIAGILGIGLFISTLRSGGFQFKKVADSKG